MDPAVFEQRYERGLTHLTEKMGKVMTDWLDELSHDLGMSVSTREGTVSIMNRYLSVADIERSKFQLFGLCALMISSKFHDDDTYNTHINSAKCAYLTADRHTIQQANEMERAILIALDYRVRSPLIQEPLSKSDEKCEEHEEPE